MLALPTLSIAIIVNDASHRVGSVIDEASVALKHAAALDFIVIDDATSDETGQTLSALAIEDDRIRLYRQPSPIGADAALWQAGTVAKGDWIVTLDAYGRDDPHDLPDMICDARQQALALVEGIPLNPRCRWRAAGLRIARTLGLTVLRSDRSNLYLIQRHALTTLPCVDRLRCFLPMLIRRSGGRIGRYQVNARHVPQAPHASLWQAPAQTAANARDWLGMWWLSRRWHAQRTLQQRRNRVYAR